ncbi:Uncharacterized protein APZ42_000642, partial [Daphnia magna]
GRPCNPDQEQAVDTTTTSSSSRVNLWMQRVHAGPALVVGQQCVLPA